MGTQALISPVHRHQLALNQQAYAARLGVSQAYLSLLESGQRPLTPKLQAKLVKAFGGHPNNLPLELANEPMDHDTLAGTLATLGYPGFAHLKRALELNPAVLVLECLRKANLDVRVVEALPWLIRRAKVNNLQNHLGYLASLAQEVTPNPHLKALLDQLAPARLAEAQAMCQSGMPQVLRRWMREKRSPLAAHWNLLTDLQSRGMARWMLPKCPVNYYAPNPNAQSRG